MEELSYFVGDVRPPGRRLIRRQLGRHGGVSIRILLRRPLPKALGAPSRGPGAPWINLARSAEAMSGSLPAVIASLAAYTAPTRNPEALSVSHADLSDNRALRLSGKDASPVSMHAQARLLHFDEPSRVPLTADQLVELYALTDWRVVFLGTRVRWNCHHYSAVSLFKALALLYLIKLSSKRALARELADRESLQALCGFRFGGTPRTRLFGTFAIGIRLSTLRACERISCLLDNRRYPRLILAVAVAFIPLYRGAVVQYWPDKDYFTSSELMLQVLISLVLSGSEPNLSLPSVTPSSPTTSVPDGHYSEVRLDSCRPLIEVWTAATETNDALPSVVGLLLSAILLSPFVNRELPGLSSVADLLTILGVFGSYIGLLAKLQKPNMGAGGPPSVPI